MTIMTYSMIASLRLPDAGNRCRTAFACRRPGAVSHAFPEVIVAWFVSQSLVFILLAFALGVIAGRLSVWPAKKAPEPVVEIDDELERIEGIGPAMANALRAAGIRTFEQLATSDDDAKRDAIRAAGLSFAPSLATWSRQARLLADGDEAAFEELTARLIAGRDTITPTADKPRPRPRPRPVGNKADTEAGTDGDAKAGNDTKAGTR
ncbi:helix-hairpin-helix domain-containing protein [Actinoplanes subglobosus]|uniref:Helix-hairpin-helix domain-containing protein n=1 Tax=Actinoplanes subglobosus TaxID=1547892 RepID=A0ABV8JB80_9ACTN